MDVPSTQAPEHVPDDVLDLAVPSADVSLTPPLVGANAPARLSLTKLALHPANTEDTWNGGIRPHRPSHRARDDAGESGWTLWDGSEGRCGGELLSSSARRAPPWLPCCRCCRAQEAATCVTLFKIGASFVPAEHASVFRNTDFLLSVAPKNQIFDRDRWRKVTSPWTSVMIMRSFMIEYGRRSGNKRRSSRCWL